MFLAFSTTNCTFISIGDDGLLDEHWSNKADSLPQHLVNGGREEGDNLLYEIQKSVAVGQDGSQGKFGWSEGDALEIVKNGFSNGKAGKFHL